jgi:hypothetical protein
MPKKVKKEDIEQWKKLRGEGLTYEEIAEETSWSRQKVAQELKKLEPKKPPEIPAVPTQDPLSYLNAMGNILRRKCPLGKRMRDGYCERAEFPAEDWELLEFKKVFSSDFIMVERGGRRYLRPRVPLWYCYECAGIRLAEDEIAKVKGSLKQKSSELDVAMERTRRDLLNHVDNVRSEISRETKRLNRRSRVVEDELNTLTTHGLYYQSTCAKVDMFGCCTVWHKNRKLITPTPLRCATCKFYAPGG